MKANSKNIIGNRYGYWTVLSYSHSLGNGRTYYNCKCDCGTTKPVLRLSLVNGSSLSCGCYHRQTATTHGGTHEKLYHVWRNMRDRCTREKHRSYALYGGRGITVCDEWNNKQSGYSAFRQWSCENGYKEGLTIDRIENDKEYSPTNCRWATRKQQANNTHNNRVITYNGLTKTLSEWGTFTGLGWARIQQRLDDDWSIESALFTPIDKKFINNVKK